MSGDKVTATRNSSGVLVNGVRRWLGYTNRLVFPVDAAAKLAVMMRRDGEEDGACAVELALAQPAPPAPEPVELVCEHCAEDEGTTP